jgi:ABC-type branched-subunit amino acid transport system substrate-binding protein
MTGRRTARRTALALALVVVAASCGTRSSDTGSGGLDNQQSTGTTKAASGSSAGFGTLANPCGPAPAGASNTASGKGVTADQITISTIADPGGYIPGLNKSLFDTAQTFADWCNSFGGINGRKINVLLKDAQVTKYKDMVVQACDDSLALVGGLGALDQLEDGDDCGLINVPASAASPEAALSTHTYQALPNIPSRFNAGPAAWIKQSHPGVESQAAALYSSIQTTEDIMNRWKQGTGKVGYNYVISDSASPIEPNWGPAVIKLKNANAKYMTLVSTYEAILPLQKEFAQQGWAPEVTQLEGNFYDQRYPGQAKDQGADTSNVFVQIPVWPIEEADQNPPTKQYLDLLKKTVPDAQPAMLGIEGWSAALMFATAAKAAGSNLTRDTLEAELKKIHDWDGGGLHGHSDPAARMPSKCFVMMTIGDSVFERAYPKSDKDGAVYNNDDHKGMACPKDGLVYLPDQPGADQYKLP